MISWEDAARRVRALPAGERIRFLVWELPDPARAGFVRSLGLPVGQAEDWRRGEPDGSSLHAQRVGDCWDLHVDRADPARDPAGHLLKDVVGGVDLPLAVLMILIIFLIPKVLK